MRATISTLSAWLLMRVWPVCMCCLFAGVRCWAAAAIFQKYGGTELGEVVETFVGQFYLQGSQMRTLPGEILLDFNLSDKTLLADSLSELAGRRIHVQTKPRGDRARYLKLARTNAATALITKLSQQSTITQRLTALAAVLKLPAIKRMECFDISHTMGSKRSHPVWYLTLTGRYAPSIVVIISRASRRVMTMRR